MWRRRDVTKPTSATDWRWGDAGEADAKATAALLALGPGGWRWSPRKGADLDGAGTGQIKAFTAAMLN